jgi:hypothetical protein
MTIPAKAALAWLLLFEGCRTPSGPFRPGTAVILTGAYLQTWGLMFLAAYYYSHKAFFHFALAFALGSVAMACPVRSSFDSRARISKAHPKEMARR